MGPARSKDMLFTGRLIAGAEAHALGIVNRLVPADDDRRAVRALARRDCGECAVDAARDKGNDPAYPREAPRWRRATTPIMVEMCYTSADFREGVTRVSGEAETLVVRILNVNVKET